jgi:uncharacterized protein YjiK
MPRFRRLTVPLLAFGLGCGVMAALAWFPRYFLPWRWLDPRLGETVSRYQVLEAGSRLDGVERNISGLTYSANTGTLFAVINKPERVVEIDLCGGVRRILPAEFGADLEAISHVEDDLFVIASEQDNVIWGARINGDTRKVEPITSQTLSLSFNRSGNEGIEGLSWDHRGQRLFLANEKNPPQVVEVSGMGNFLLNQPANLALKIWRQDKKLADLVGDISSISYNEAWQAMTVLSHESRRVYRFDGLRSPTLMLRLERGYHGLMEHVEQPEGLAFGPDGSAYIVAEPNLFYRFVPVGQPGSGPPAVIPKRSCGAVEPARLRTATGAAAPESGPGPASPPR